MGEQNIRRDFDNVQKRAFVQGLLEDVQALEWMIQEGWIESGVRRIGAEQEVFLVDASYRPSNVALDVMERLDEEFTTELGLFQLEANMPPLELGDGCLSEMERMLNRQLERMRVAARECRARPVMVGILPTLTKANLGLDSMLPSPRYYELNDTMVGQRGGEFRTMIKGLDELNATHDNVMFEACNSGFQVHFQVGVDEFVQLYNLAQAVTAPVLAAGVNSPVLLQHRLWHETRVALFQQSLDVRSETKTARGGRQRVSFGDRWVQSSVLEIYREDIARFRALLAVEPGESSLAMIDRGEVPPLRSLCLHNGTVYRWNRPCYGIKDGKAHLRIENRVLPAGPTILDEVANAAFFFGLMCAVGDEYGDITKVMAFDDAKSNFTAAARYGLDARLRWLHRETLGADELILKHLLPLARAGLAARDIPSADVDRYLGVLEERVASRRTGAQWALDSLAAMSSQGTVEERQRALTEAMCELEGTGEPVHTWPLASLRDERASRDSFRTVGQMMTTDLFTLHPEDVVDLAASLMDWEHLRHVPVEDDEGTLVGLITSRRLLRRLARRQKDAPGPVPVREIMKADPITIGPEATCLEAIHLMRENRIGCLPVVRGGRLIGIVSESDFVRLTARLLESWLQPEEGPGGPSDATGTVHASNGGSGDRAS